MGRKSYEAIVIALILFLAACKKEDKISEPPKIPVGKRVFVVCEGSLGNGNSGLVMFLPEQDTSYEEVFKSINGASPGDVLQSMIAIGDSYFLCVNNSDKIVVINKADLKITGSIAVHQPRYILPVSATKAYVSSLFDNSFYIINPQTLKLTGSINLPAKNAEGMLLWNDKAIISCWDTATNNLVVINTVTDGIATQINIGNVAPQEAIFDKEGKLWVLSGNVAQGKDAALTKLNATTGQIEKLYNFPNKAEVVRLVMNDAKDSLYFIELDYSGGIQNNGVYRMGIKAGSLPSQAFIPAQQFQYFWALGIEPGTGNIFVGDPKGFIQKGTVMIYGRDGILQQQFATAVGPGHFFFDY